MSLEPEISLAAREWLLDWLAAYLEQHQGDELQARTDPTQAARVYGQFGASALTGRQSNLTARPGQPLTTVVLGGRRYAVGDTRKQYTRPQETPQNSPFVPGGHVLQPFMSLSSLVRTMPLEGTPVPSLSGAFLDLEQYQTVRDEPFQRDAGLEQYFTVPVEMQPTLEQHLAGTFRPTLQERAYACVFDGRLRLASWSLDNRFDEGFGSNKPASVNYPVQGYVEDGSYETRVYEGAKLDVTEGPGYQTVKALLYTFDRVAQVIIDPETDLRMEVELDRQGWGAEQVDGLDNYDASLQLTGTSDGFVVIRIFAGAYIGLNDDAETLRGVAQGTVRIERYFGTTQGSFPDPYTSPMPPLGPYDEQPEGYKWDYFDSPEEYRTSWLEGTSDYQTSGTLRARLQPYYEYINQPVDPATGYPYPKPGPEISYSVPAFGYYPLDEAERDKIPFNSGWPETPTVTSREMVGKLNPYIYDVRFDKDATDGGGGGGPPIFSAVRAAEPLRGDFPFPFPPLPPPGGVTRRLLAGKLANPTGPSGVESSWRGLSWTSLEYTCDVFVAAFYDSETESNEDKDVAVALVKESGAFNVLVSINTEPVGSWPLFAFFKGASEVLKHLDGTVWPPASGPALSPAYHFASALWPLRNVAYLSPFRARLRNKLDKTFAPEAADAPITLFFDSTGNHDEASLEFCPKGFDTAFISEIGGVDNALRDSLTAPFDETKPKTLLSTNSLSVAANLSGVTLPEHYRLKLYIYAVGRASLAPQSYQPLGTPPKSKVWRLAPEVTLAVAEFEREANPDNTVQMTFGAPVNIARVHLEVRGFKQDSPLWTSDIAG